MNLEYLFNSSMLDELYNNEKDDFETYVIQKNNENKNFYENGSIQEQIIEIMKDYIKDEEIINKIKVKFREYEKSSLDEYEYWCSKYFKKGFIDCMRLKKDFQNEEKEDTLFNYEYNCFAEYMDEYRLKKVKKIPKYIELNKKIKEITDKYPRTITFIEDEVIDEITKEEQQAIIDILIIQEEKYLLEEKEVFKLGGKEMLCFLKQMDLLK